MPIATNNTDDSDNDNDDDNDSDASALLRGASRAQTRWHQVASDAAYTLYGECCQRPSPVVCTSLPVRSQTNCLTVDYSATSAALQMSYAGGIDYSRSIGPNVVVNRATLLGGRAQQTLHPKGGVH